MLFIADVPTYASVPLDVFLCRNKAVVNVAQLTWATLSTPSTVELLRSQGSTCIAFIQRLRPPTIDMYRARAFVTRTRQPHFPAIGSRLCTRRTPYTQMTLLRSSRKPTCTSCKTEYQQELQKRTPRSCGVVGICRCDLALVRLAFYTRASGVQHSHRAFFATRREVHMH